MAARDRGERVGLMLHVNAFATRLGAGRDRVGRDGPIRELLAAVEPQPFWAPNGQTVILQDKVIVAAADPVAVGLWVEAHRGRLDRTVPVGHRSVLSKGAVPDLQRFFLMPSEALT